MPNPRGDLCRSCKAPIEQANALNPLSAAKLRTQVRCTPCHKQFKAWVAAGCPDSGATYEPRFDGVQTLPEDIEAYEAAEDLFWDSVRIEGS